MTHDEIIHAEFLAAARRTAELPPPVALEIAFAGRSNVGKSSLLNRVMGRSGLARTSSTPGCTRGIVFFDTRTRSGTKLTLVDLPGYGYAARSHEEKLIWAELIENYLLTRPALTALAVLVDARRGLQPDDRDLLKMMSEPRAGRAQVECVVIATKLDKLSRSERMKALSALERVHPGIVGFSTELPETTVQVWQRLRRAGLRSITPAAPEGSPPPGKSSQGTPPAAS